MFSLICARINGWVNTGEAGDLKRHRAHHDVTVMPSSLLRDFTRSGVSAPVLPMRLHTSHMVIFTPSRTASKLRESLGQDAITLIEQSPTRRYSKWHDDVIKWKHFPRYWLFVRGIHRSPVYSPHKGQWRGAFDVFFDLRPNKRLSKHLQGWWFETLSCSLWRHCDGMKQSHQILQHSES